MKILAVALLLSITPVIAFAMTPDQIEEAQELLKERQVKIGLLGSIRIAIENKTGTVSLVLHPCKHSSGRDKKGNLKWDYENWGPGCGEINLREYPLAEMKTVLTANVLADIRDDEKRLKDLGVEFQPAK